MNNPYPYVQQLIARGNVLQQIDGAVALMAPDIEAGTISIDTELAYDLLLAAQQKLHAQAEEIETLRTQLRRSA